MLITNKYVSTESFLINAKSNRIGRTLTYKYLIYSHYWLF